MSICLAKKEGSVCDEGGSGGAERSGPRHPGRDIRAETFAHPPVPQSQAPAAKAIRRSPLDNEDGKISDETDGN